MPSYNNIIKSVSHLLDIAGLLFIYEQSLDSNDAQHAKWKQLYEKLRSAGIIWANDIHARIKNNNGRIRGEEKSILFNNISQAINNTISAIENMENPRALLTSELEALRAIKTVLINYIDNSADVIAKLNASGQPNTHLFVAFGDVLKEAQING